jgi:hypothetical protein
MAWVDSALADATAAGADEFAGMFAWLLAPGARKEPTDAAGADDESLSSAGGPLDLLDGEHAATAAKAAIAMTTWVARAVRVRRAIPHAATPGSATVRRKLIT